MIEKGTLGLRGVSPSSHCLFFFSPSVLLASMITTNAVHQECDYGGEEIAVLPSHRLQFGGGSGGKIML